MIRHVVMFRWTDDATDDRRAAVSEALSRFPDTIPSIRGYRFGADLGLRDGNWDFVVVGDFDDVDGYQAYSDDEGHQQVIRDLIAPIVAERAAVQYELPG